MSKRAFEEAVDYAASVTSLDDQALPPSPPRVFPGQWSDDFSEIDPTELNSPPSLFTTINRFATTVSNITNLFGIRDYFLKKFFRKQVIIAKPVINNDGSRKKRLIDGGVADSDALNQYITFNTINEEDVEVDDWSFTDVLTSTPRRPVSSPLKNSPLKASPLRTSPPSTSPPRVSRLRASPNKALPVTPPPRRNDGSLSPTHRMVIRNRLRGNKAILEYRKSLQKLGHDSPIWPTSPALSLLLPPVDEDSAAAQVPPEPVSRLAQRFITNQYQEEIKPVEPEVSLYSNDLSELPDAPPTKSVRLSDYVRSKPFFQDEAVTDMMDSTLESVTFSPVRGHNSNIQQDPEGHGNPPDEALFGGSPTQNPAPALSESSGSPESVGFRGIPEDTWGSSDNEDSLEESQISLELIEDLEQTIQSKLTLEQPVGPAVPPPVLPLVPPITDDDDAILNDIAELTGHGTEDLKLDGVRVTTHDLKTILPRLFNGNPSAWLNDNIVNDFLTLLVDKVKKDEGYVHKKDGPAPPVHNLSSQWFVSADRNIDNVVRWATKKQLGGKQFLDSRLVLLPVCETGHWRLVAVKPQNRTIEYLDSMGMSPDNSVVKILKLIHAILGDDFQRNDWTVLPEQRSLRQKNGSDCGVFTVLNALCLLRGEEPSLVDVSPGMQDARKRIVLSLLENKVSWGL